MKKNDGKYYACENEMNKNQKSDTVTWKSVQITVSSEELSAGETFPLPQGGFPD